MAVGKSFTHFLILGTLLVFYGAEGLHLKGLNSDIKENRFQERTDQNPSVEEDPDKPYLEKTLQQLVSQQKRAREQKWRNLRRLSELESQFEENDGENGFGSNDEDSEDHFLENRYDETRGLNEHVGHAGNQDWEEKEDNEENDDLENDDINVIEKRKNYDLQSKDVNGNRDENGEEEEEEIAKRGKSDENDDEEEEEEEEEEENDEREIADHEDVNDDQEDDNGRKRSNLDRAKLDFLDFWMRELNRAKAEETRCGGNCLQ